MQYTCPPLELSIMGRPVVIGSADAGLLAILAAAYAEWLQGGPMDGPPIQLTLEAGDETAPDTPVQIGVVGPRLRLNGAGLHGWADARSLEAFCRVPASLAARPGALVGEVTDTLLLFLLARSGRVPVHAAGILCGRTAVVLAGRSGSGKSTLSLAAMARGLRILSDDTVYIQLQPRLRIWAFPRPVHVFPADAPGFTDQVRLRGGKLKAVLPLPPCSEPPVADRAAVVLLERGDRVRLEPIEPSVAAAALSRLEPGFDLLAESSARAVEAVTASGAWRLVLSRDPAEAIDVLMDRLGPEAVSAAASHG